MGFFDRIFPAAHYAYTVSLCTIIKDENEYLEEWMSYHRLIGVEHFYFYDNGSKVPVAHTLKQLNLLQYATVIPFLGVAQQVKAYKHCIRKFGKTSRWIGFIDMDEFIVPKTHPHNLAVFLKDYEDYGGLGINWMLFGSGGHVKRTNRPQLESFLLRAENNFDTNRHIKTIVQTRYAKAPVNAHYWGYKKSRFCVNENFEPIEDSFSDVSTAKIQLNHYYCRSLEEYQHKITRGIADTGHERKIDEFYRHDKDSNKIKDTTILDILKSKQNS